MYKIGELAQASNVSKRTIDYYTKMGLLECERSETGYRYYNEEALEDIRFIEQCKKTHMSLKEIRQRRYVLKSKEIDQKAVLEHIEPIKNKMGHLQTELKEIYEMIEKLDASERKKVMNQLSPQTLALFQSLTLFLN